MKNILVIGATGTVGNAALTTLQNLASEQRLNPLAAVRSEAQQTTMKERGVESRWLDLNDAQTLPAALQDIDGLLLLTGYSVDMLKHSKRVIDEAKRQGVQHIVHVGASGNDTAEVAHWGWHRMVEAYIEQQGFAFTHLQPEAFMQNLLTFGWVQPGSLTNLIGNSVWSWVDGNDVGKLAAHCLTNPQAHNGKTYQLGYDKASMATLAAKLSEAFSLNLELAAVDPDEFYLGAVAHGADPAYMDCVRTQFHLNAAGKIADADATFDAGLFEQITGDAPTQWDAYIARHSAELKSQAA